MENKKQKTKKIIMTLLVRDEVDIIEKNICFHLNNGIDYIIVTDNGSIDGTRDILEKYQKKGFLTVIDEPNHTYEQDKWVSRMARMAIDQYHADYLIHCDADEFWYEKNGKLREVIEKIVDLAYINVINYLPPYIIKNKTINFNDYKFIVKAGESCPINLEERNPNRYLFYSHNHPKIITNNKYRDIEYGNHNVKSKTPKKRKYIDSIFIHHFPIRSFNHFKTKVINGGSSYEKNPVDNKELGWHWKKWYQIYKEGEIKNAYKELCLFGKISENQKNGMIIFSEVPKKIKYSREFFHIKNFLRKLIKF